ncbi:hypothetical protein NEHOM01_1584 [Nematocida homosporus]|uniref:uncharacterized protein n=1 Tax=Nematocida homosporus TaxID=1912981 RepID=UPI0022202B3C|nr:uncharacterized protein NEHOM01_1584 [Nematocida homosporus]KAI5186616.1 hypothetical protein NEHOM01_1584 [Nematocida homosporus]
MQTEQTKTNSTRPVKSSNKYGLYIIMTAVVVGIAAYIWAVYEFKFNRVYPEAMGSMFYSWVKEGANDCMFAKKVEKFPGGPAQAKNAAYLKKHLDDHYPEHFPRDSVNYLSMSFPQLDLYLALRRVFVRSDITLAIKDKAVVDELLKTRPADVSRDELKKFLATRTAPIFFGPRTEAEIQSALEEFGRSIPNRQEAFADIADKLIDIFGLFSSEVDSYRYDDKGRPAARAVDLVTELLELVNGVDKKLMAEEVRSHLTGTDVDMLFKGLNLSGGKSPERALAEKFFKDMTYGSLSVYSAFAYSRMAYLFYFLTLDYDFGLELPIEADLATRQNVYEERIDRLGLLIGYSMARLLSRNIGQEYVTKSRSALVNLLFTRKVVDPYPGIEADLQNFVIHLKGKKKLVRKALTGRAVAPSPAVETTA